MFKRIARAGLLVLAASVLAAAGSIVAAVVARAQSSKPPANDAAPATGRAGAPLARVLEFPVGGRDPATAVREIPWARYQAPLDGPVDVTRPFEPPSDRYAAGHRGVDLAGAPGQLVHSAGAGTVVFAGMVGGRPVVSVEHAGGLRTTYEPVSPTAVAGQAVVPGTQLGTLIPGHPSCSERVCLHWGLRTGDGVYLDPLSLLQRPRIRLLPAS